MVDVLKRIINKKKEKIKIFKLEKTENDIIKEIKNFTNFTNFADKIKKHNSNKKISIIDVSYKFPEKEDYVL